MRNEDINQNINHQREEVPTSVFYQRCGDRLNSSGLLSDYFINDRTGIGAFKLTDEGRVLARLLKKLFPDSGTSPGQIDWEEVAGVVQILLYSPT